MGTGNVYLICRWVSFIFTSLALLIDVCVVYSAYTNPCNPSLPGYTACSEYTKRPLHNGLYRTQLKLKTQIFHLNYKFVKNILTYNQLTNAPIAQEQDQTAMSISNQNCYQSCNKLTAKK